MARFAVIESGRVRNHAEADDDFAASQGWVPAGESHRGDLWDGQVFTPAPPQPEPSQFEIDRARYSKRAEAKDGLLAFMAADNMSRVRSGEWTVQQLTSLISDPAVAAANSYMSTLSFELAAQAIQAATTPLLTPEIKALWVGKLQEHFYIGA